MLQNEFSSRQFLQTKWSSFVHSTTRNAYYVHRRLDSILELSQTFLIGFKYHKKNSFNNQIKRKHRYCTSSLHKKKSHLSLLILHQKSKASKVR